MMQEMIKMPTRTPYSQWGKVFTLCEQDTDSKFYDANAPSRVTEREYKDGSYEMSEALILSRTRLEFTGEHIVWADSPYLKSLGNEDEIFTKFLHSLEN